MKKKFNNYIGIIILIFLILLIILFVIISKNNSILHCSKITNSIDGFTINDTVNIKISKSKISDIKLKKEIVISSTYANQDEYEKVIENSLKRAYLYLNENDYKITNSDNDVYVDVDTKESGVLLNNFSIKLNDPNDKTDINFNVINTIDNNDSSIKINDEVTKKSLKKKVEDQGFTCK